jgi:hypothetical protein
MENQSDLEIIIIKPGGLSIFLTVANEAVCARVEEQTKKKSWHGQISDLSVKKLSWLMKSPSMISRRLFINKKTLEPRFCEGLLGSGSGSSLACNTIMAYCLNRDIIEPENKPLDEISKQAKILSVNIAETMIFGTFKYEDLKKLEEINPYKCKTKHDVAIKLIEDLTRNACWSESIYAYERELLTKIIRRFLFALLFNEKAIDIFTKDQKNSSLIK